MPGSARTAVVFNEMANSIVDPAGDESVSAISSPRAQDLSRSMDGTGGATDNACGPHGRFKVHDAHLYTDLLDASDWSEFLERERHEKKREALAQHSEEEAAERARRDALLKKSTEDAKAMAAARRRAEKVAQEEKETRLFRQRNDAFFRHQEELLEKWKPIEASNRAHTERVRERIYRQWERDVFLPTQREINAKVERKCADDTRPHLLEMARLDQANAGSTNATNGTITSLPAEWSGKLTWKEKKDQLWRSFLHESNKKSRVGGRGGLFLDVMDEVEYSPMEQCRRDTIRYRRRQLPASDVDARRAESRQLELAYTTLGLAYRDEENRSRTGVLTETRPGRTVASRSAHPPQRTSSHDAAAAHDEMMMAAATAEECGTNGGEGRSPMRQLPPPVPYRLPQGVYVPHTYLPYDFEANARRKPVVPRPSRTTPRRDELTILASNDGSPTGLAQESFVAGSVRSRASAAGSEQSPPALHDMNMSMSVPKSVPASVRRQSVREVQRQWTAVRAKLDKQQPLRQVEGTTHGPQVVLECERAIMPLPLTQPHGSSPGESKIALPWMQDPSTSPLPREAYLPVPQWSDVHIKETFYCRYNTADGSTKPCSERQKEGGYLLRESNVMFDHFDYPREADPLHFGKRMEIWS